jgi:hypothetical protein
LTLLRIPSSVTVIGQYAFRGCSGLMQVELPSSLTTIGGRAFSYCSGVTQLMIPSSVTTVRAGAFSYCSGLTRLQIPSSFVEFGLNVFRGVTKLEHLTLIGSVLSPAVVHSLEERLTSTAKVVGAGLVGWKFGPFTYGGVKFGRFTIVAA